MQLFEDHDFSRNIFYYRMVSRFFTEDFLIWILDSCNALIWLFCGHNFFAVVELSCFSERDVSFTYFKNSIFFFYLKNEGPLYILCAIVECMLLDQRPGDTLT